MSLAPFLALLPLLPLSVVVFHCTIVVLQFLHSCLFYGPILSGWSTISWFLVIVTLWGYLGQCHCVGGGVLLVLFGCRLSACSQDVVSFTEIEIKNTKQKKMHQGVGAETPSPVSPSHSRLSFIISVCQHCCCWCCCGCCG